MIKLKSLGAALGVVAVAAFAGQATAQMVDGPEVSWKLSVWGKQRAFTAGAEKMAELLKEKTGGKFTVEIFYGEALSKSRENLDGLKANAFEMAMICNFYHPQKNPALMVLTMPFLPLGDWKKNVAVRDAVYEHPAVQEELAKWNAKPYVSSYLPQYEFMGKGEPPMKLDDWKGMRVRAGGGIGKAMEALGATPMTTTATEVYTAVQRGTMDAASFPMTYSHVAYKVHEVTDWYTANLSPGTSDCPVLFNKTAYEALPDQYQKLLGDIRPEVVEAQVQAYIDIDKKNYPMLDAKLKKVVYTDEQLAEFRKAGGKPIIDAWIAENQDKFDAKGLVDMVMKVASEN